MASNLIRGCGESLAIRTALVLFFNTIILILYDFGYKVFGLWNNLFSLRIQCSYVSINYDTIFNRYSILLIFRILICESDFNIRSFKRVKDKLKIERLIYYKQRLQKLHFLRCYVDYLVVFLFRNEDLYFVTYMVMKYFA